MLLCDSIVKQGNLHRSSVYLFTILNILGDRDCDLQKEAFTPSDVNTRDYNIMFCYNVST